VREADVAAALDHPQIVSVYNRGETDDQLWIAMQFVDGTDADAALRTGTMTVPRAVHIISEVGKALDFAHAQNVVHRDVKPANFLLSGPVGEGERVLLGDFALEAAGVDVVSVSLSTVYQAADPGGAQRPAAALGDQTAARPGSQSAAAVPGLPLSRCVSADDSGGLVPKFWCIATADRYMFKAVARQLANAQQQLPAQYRILTG
jgi:serine/threonine protein kinase